MSPGERLALFLATGCCIGKIPLAPGTFGSLWGIPVWLVLAKAAPAVGAAFLALFVALAVVTAHIASRALGQRDPAGIVIDETAGMAVTLAGLPCTWAVGCLGFVIFRILDITKPFPIRWIENNVRGGAGIVMDDIAAGIIGNITLRIILYLTEI